MCEGGSRASAVDPCCHAVDRSTVPIWPRVGVRARHGSEGQGHFSQRTTPIRHRGQGTAKGRRISTTPPAAPAEKCSHATQRPSVILLSRHRQAQSSCVPLVQAALYGAGGLHVLYYRWVFITASSLTVLTVLPVYWASRHERPGCSPLFPTLPPVPPPRPLSSMLLPRPFPSPSDDCLPA